MSTRMNKLPKAIAGKIAIEKCIHFMMGASSIVSNDPIKIVVSTSCVNNNDEKKL